MLLLPSKYPQRTLETHRTEIAIFRTRYSQIKQVVSLPATFTRVAKCLQVKELGETRQTLPNMTTFPCWGSFCLWQPLGNTELPPKIGRLLHSVSRNPTYVLTRMCTCLATNMSLKSFDKLVAALRQQLFGNCNTKIRSFVAMSLRRCFQPCCAVKT